MPNTRYIMAIDLGTTGNRVFCFDEKGGILSSAYRELKQYFPRPGWVEHDAMEIWDAVSLLVPEAISGGGLDPAAAVTIGITNQRETSVLWDAITGIPMHNAIVWQCRRTSAICEDLKNRGFEELFRQKTGLLLDPYFSGTKIKWLLDNVPDAWTLAKNGRLRFGTIDTWILWKLTGGAEHSTDYTNASRTLLFDIRKMEWSDELCSVLGIPMNILPSVKPSAGDYGKTSGCPGLPDGIPVSGVAGDQQAAMAGQGCVYPGSIKNTYGTGCFVLMNNGHDFSLSSNGLITTLTPDNSGNPVYAIEGSVFIGGAVMQWLRDYMNFFTDASESENMAMSEGRGDDIVFIPAFVGMGAPYWKMDTRGAIFGLTRDTTKKQIVKAALKSIALQSMEIIKAMEQDACRNISELRVDGGATANRYLMQYQSDILDVPLLVPENRESTALGAAYLAGLSAGIYGSIDEISSGNPIIGRYKPVMESGTRLKEISLWRDAVNRLL